MSTSSPANEIRSIISQIRRPNIAVIGRTGVGKSSLINAVFKIDVAVAGAGKPITREYTRYAPLDSPIIIYDSPGYEAGKEQDFLKNTFDFLEDFSGEGIEEQIHLIWYLISAPSARLEDFDTSIINKINENGIPAIIILSQCDRASKEEIAKIKETINSSNFHKVFDLIEVSASPLILSNGLAICESFGLSELVSKTIDLLPEIYSEAVVIAQMVNIKSKRTLAWEYISNASLACFAAGAAPLPLTSPVAAITALSYLCNKITMLYGFSKWGLTLGVAGITIGGAVTLAASTILDLLSTLFPGISILAGGAAATYTAVAGLAYASTCEKLAIEDKRGSQLEVKEFLKRTFKEEFDRYNSIEISNATDLVNIGQRWKDYKI